MSFGMTVETVDAFLRKSGWAIRKYATERRAGDLLAALIYMEKNSSIDFLVNDYELYFLKEEDFFQFVLELPDDLNQLGFY